MLYVRHEFITDPTLRIQQRSNTVVYGRDDLLEAINDAMESARNGERVIAATVFCDERDIEFKRYNGDYEGCALGEWEFNSAESLADALAGFAGSDAVFDCDGELVCVVRGR